MNNQLGGMVTEATDLIKNMSTDGAKQYANAADEYVRANPWTALGVAGAAGLLIGVLLARR